MNLLIKSISFLATALILTTSAWQAYTVVHFYANQDAIEKELCENIEKPEMKCHGHCQLNKKLNLTALNDAKVPAEESPKLGLVVFQSVELLSEIEIFKTLNITEKIEFKENHIGIEISNCLLDPPEFA